MSQPKRPAGTSSVYQPPSTSSKWDPANRPLHRLLAYLDIIFLARFRYEYQTLLLKDWGDDETQSIWNQINTEYEEIRTLFKSNCGTWGPPTDELNRNTLLEAKSRGWERASGYEERLGSVCKCLKDAYDNSNYPTRHYLECEHEYMLAISDGLKPKKPNVPRKTDILRSFEKYTSYVNEQCRQMDVTVTLIMVRYDYLKLFASNGESIDLLVHERFADMARKLQSGYHVTHVELLEPLITHSQLMELVAETQTSLEESRQPEPKTSIDVDEDPQRPMYDETEVQSEDNRTLEERRAAFDKLPDSVKDAWEVYEPAKHELDNDPSLTKKITDTSIYERIKANGTPVAGFDTWARYVREAKKALGISASKHASNPKHETRSIVGPEHLQTRTLERT